jgi:diguanylate cyclase (GGDEF)-like protein/PAS domain S-box-containing protein
MQVIIFLTSIAFTLSTLTGAYVFLRNPRGLANRVFVPFSLFFVIWHFGTVFQLSAPSEAAARTWFGIATAGWFFIAPIFLHFVFALTAENCVRKNRILFAVLYTPAVVLLIARSAGASFIKEFVHSDFGWTYRENILSPWLIFSYVLAFAYILSGAILLYRWGRNSHDRVKRAQSRTILLSLGIGMAAYLITAYFPFLTKADLFPGMSHLFTLAWNAGVGYAIIRHGFMAISPESAARSILSTMADGILLLDREARVIEANPSACAILRVEKDLLLHRFIEESLPDVFLGNTIMKQLEAAGAVRDQETRIRGEDGLETFISFSVSYILDRSGAKEGTVIALRDISDRKRVEDELKHLATHDVLTGLPNRAVLNDRFRNAILRAQRHKHQVAVLFLDVDHFKKINDDYGHDTGDLILKEVASLLVKSVRDYDTVARFGGDEFVIVLPDLEGQNVGEAIIKRIRKACAEPVQIGTLSVHLTLSIGVSCFPAHAGNIEDLYRFADLALYRAKSLGRDRYQFYSPEIDAVSQKTTKLEKDIRVAISRNEFELYYQPIYDITTRKIVAVESLLRWHHPDFGFLLPMDFIPLAERSDLIIPLGEWVLEAGCRQLHAWRKNGIFVPLAVNVSARQFQDPELLTKITRALSAYDLPASALQLEFTESTAMIEVEKTVRTVQGLKGAGIAIIIDDFGSGYSSMGWLKHLQVYAIKIDRFFIQNLAHDKNDAAIVRAMASMAHSMGLMVIAEGIESEDQLSALSSLHLDHPARSGCDYLQGFLFSVPAPADEVLVRLKSAG